MGSVELPDRALEHDLVAMFSAMERASASKAATQ
jgi:hypothetical protein